MKLIAAIDWGDFQISLIYTEFVTSRNRGHVVSKYCPHEPFVAVMPAKLVPAKSGDPSVHCATGSPLSRG